MPNYQISIADASTETARWRQANPNSLKGFVLHKEDLQGVLNEPGVEKARIYLALDSNNKEKIVLVGVDSSGNDILYPANPANNQGVYDFSTPCPDMCGEANALNS
jgi:hypothetical protein